MSIRIGLSTSGVNEQMEVLKHFPDLAQKHYRPAIKRDIEILSNVIMQNFPPGLTGRAEDTFGSKITGRGFGLKGKVGWFDKTDPWYPNVLEYGSRAHAINKGASVRGGKRLFEMGMGTIQRRGGVGHVMINGEWKTVSAVEGVKAYGFMAKGFSAVQSVVENDIELANEAILAELATI